MLEKAQLLAFERHKGQFRWDKKTPYYEGHLVPVMKKVGEVVDKTLALYDDSEEVRKFKELVQTCAILHDILEDTTTTENELLEKFGQEVLDIVKLLTHKNEDDYIDYIVNLSDDDVANIIKQADLEHNSETTTGNKLKLYRMAKKYLECKMNFNSILSVAQLMGVA